MWVCLCKGVTDHEIRELLESPFINTVSDVGRACGAGTGCGGCRPEIADLCAQAQAAAVDSPRRRKPAVGVPTAEQLGDIAG